MRPTEIKLLATPAKEIAESILAGELPPETYDLEVIDHLSLLAPELVFYRIDEFNHNGGGDRKLDVPNKVEFSSNQVQIALENGIKIRPISR